MHFVGNRRPRSCVEGNAHLTRVPDSGFGRVRSVAVAAWATVLLSTLAVADSAFGTPSLSVTPDTVTVGDPIRITLLAPGAQSGEIAWPEFPNSRVGDLMLLRRDTLDDRRTRKQLGGPALMLTTAAFDTGSMSTGDLWLAIGGDTTHFEPRTVTVQSVLADTAGADFAPLKAQEDLRLTFNDLVKLFGPWVAGIGLLLILWTLVRRWLAARRRKREVGGEIIPLLSPYEEAMQALVQLREDNPLAKGDQKVYVTALALIVKRLLERTHMKPVLEMTTWEVRRWLAETRTLCEGDDLLAILEAGDGVKFAKGALDARVAENLMKSAERIVEAYIPRPETPDGGLEEEPAAGRTAGGDGGEVADDENEPVPSWRTHTASHRANQGRRP